MGGQRKKWTEIGFQLYWESALEKYIRASGKAHLQGVTYNKDDQEHRRTINQMAVGRFGTTARSEYCDIPQP